MTTLSKPTLDWFLLYVADPLKSAALYANIFGVQPVDRAATFSMFVLPNGLKVGLWAKSDVQPPANAPGGIEISFTEENNAAVSARSESLQGLGFTIVQQPTDMDFGFTFVAADPDGHRLRVFAPRG
jgi:predicted enzyme related to lactoylglutathione lyase